MYYNMYYATRLSVLMYCYILSTYTNYEYNDEVMYSVLLRIKPYRYVK